MNTKDKRYDFAKRQARRKGSDDTEATETTESKTRDNADRRHTMRLFKTEAKDDRKTKRRTTAVYIIATIESLCEKEREDSAEPAENGRLSR